MADVSEKIEELRLNAAVMSERIKTDRRKIEILEASHYKLKEACLPIIAEFPTLIEDKNSIIRASFDVILKLLLASALIALGWDHGIT